MNEKISADYAAYIVSELLFEKGLINKATYKEICKRLKPDNSHILQSDAA